MIEVRELRVNTLGQERKNREKVRADKKTVYLKVFVCRSEILTRHKKKQEKKTMTCMNKICYLNSILSSGICLDPFLRRIDDRASLYRSHLFYPKKKK